MLDSFAEIILLMTSAEKSLTFSQLVKSKTSVAMRGGVGSCSQL